MRVQGRLGLSVMVGICDRGKWTAERMNEDICPGTERRVLLLLLLLKMKMKMKLFPLLVNLLL